MKLKEFIHEWEKELPLQLQASYDNCGLIVGDPEQEITGFLTCLDCTEAVVAEAARLKVNVIIAHHPVIFSGLKHINQKHWVERTVRAAIKMDIAIYACHTNLDHHYDGVNGVICERLGLKNCKVLSPQKDALLGIKVFVPIENKEEVRAAMFAAGAGQLGNYDECSFSLTGEGTFRPLVGANPTEGEIGVRTTQQENWLSLICTRWQLPQVLTAMRAAHSYEEVAHEIIPLENTTHLFGAGMLGELEREMDEADFLQMVGQRMKCAVVRHTALRGKSIQKVAVCGGSGFSLLRDAIHARADIFVTSDIKYHDFFEADKQIILADIGHFESEQFTIQHLVDRLTKKFPKFAAHSTDVLTNPVQYTLVHGNKE
jgi:dinuclear metal center YbgI/SA1388 family protein